MNRKSEIKSFVSRKIAILQAEENSGEGKAMLADLRRGLGHAPGELPELFGTILLDLPEKFMSSDGTATAEEWASYIALTLYALHRQGGEVNNELAHTDANVSIGRALKRYSKQQMADKKDDNAEKRVLQKMQMLVTSKDMGELSYHLRGVVQLLKREGIPLNYGMLAADLYEFQDTDGKNCVSLRWGQDFYREKNKKQDEEALL